MIQKFFVLALSGLLLFTSCHEEVNHTPPAEPALNLVMPLGASRVEGARPEYESYRYELWKLLQAGGWDVDFIGSMQDPFTYPALPGSGFDTDHEGHAGWTSGQLRGGIPLWLDQNGAPDIVLFSSPGGNDALENRPFERAVTNIHAIIDALQRANPSVTILIEQMAPARSDRMTPELTSYFEQMQQEIVNIANIQTTPASRVIPINMYSGFSDDFLADELHYNQAGAEYIANRYYDVLTDVLRK